MKHRITHFALAVSIASSACAQCIVPSVVDIGAISCSGFDVTVTFTGGPPMTSYWAAIFVDGIEYQTGGTSPTGYTYHVPWTTSTAITSINVTAADLNGCQAIGAWTGFLQRPQMDLQYSLTLDCNTGLRTLRWTNANMACGSVGSHSYTVNTSTGTVASAFTQESASVWRYNIALPAGTHTFGIDATPSTYPGYNCSGSLQCWALSTTGLVPLSAPAVTPGDCGVNFSLQAVLSGAYTSGALMSDALRTATLLPASEPYTALGYSYTGNPANLTVTPSMLATTGNNAIVDWVVVELRNATTPAVTVHSKAALLQRDGDVMDTDGDPYLNFPVPAGSYHVALRHRNHLGTMTASPRVLGVDPSSTSIDFYGTGSGVYGTNARVLKSGKYCLWPGDANFNGTVKYAGSANDRDVLLQVVGGGTPTNTVSNVYHGADINMDGSVKYAGSANDRDIILQTIGGSVPTATRTQQLP
ncbi:MAG: hypothetical protein KA175_12920 [Flavobacteriales bacterium]|nr:hypothetical protein [Flavobacteriales bacterium]MBP6698515.1 hypothetical protein [Flavobacteriales bacterium]